MFANFFRKLLRRHRKPYGPRTKAEIGRDGENAAAKHLTRSGMEIVERNWSCKAGEIDIICRQRDTWVFVEVKASDRLGYFPPEQRIDWEKRRRLRRMSKIYLGHKFGTVAYRFDVISVWWENDEARIRHIENAF